MPAIVYDKEHDKVIQASQNSIRGHRATCLVYDSAHGSKHTTNTYKYPYDCGFCMLDWLLDKSK